MCQEGPCSQTPLSCPSISMEWKEQLWVARAWWVLNPALVLSSGNSGWHWVQWMRNCCLGPPQPTPLKIWGKQHLRWKGMFFLSLVALLPHLGTPKRGILRAEISFLLTGQDTYKHIQIKAVLVLQFSAVLITETQRRVIRYHYRKYFRLWKWIHFLEGIHTTLFLIFVSWEMKIERLPPVEFFFKYPGIVRTLWLIWKHLLFHITYRFVFNNLAGLER